eukprot:CAMPEP_0116983080 /NCGR_PEP_ID=MMETSP0467-20121206/60738_1 /TAXON_ID=283647 /ORGANISM="Mesodinium pulex, Strain SPMC105" /LENGTH=56 /DNA_ID=CAMNT_0004677721 /DNA_START=1849 /DNA_END=2019 /DNA_ORIENTATION=-
MMLKSFIGSQKGSIARNLTFKFRKYMNLSEDYMEEIYTLLLKLFRASDLKDTQNRK